MHDEMWRIWKEAVVTSSGHYPGICLEGLRKTTKTSIRTAGVLAEIRIERLSSTSPERQHYANPLGRIILKRVVEK
jgi:hypothetical protein